MNQTEDFNGVWRGAIDIHVHAAPDPIASRRFDALELAEAARAASMRGFIFKSHEYPTVPVAYVLNRAVPGIEVFGAISLDYEVGGLNPAALEAPEDGGAQSLDADLQRQPLVDHASEQAGDQCAR